MPFGKHQMRVSIALHQIPHFLQTYLKSFADQAPHRALSCKASDVFENFSEALIIERVFLLDKILTY